MKHRLQMSIEFKKQVVKFLMRHEHLSLEGLISLGIERSIPRVFTHTPAATEVIPHDLNTRANRALLDSYISSVRPKAKRKGAK